MTDIQLFGRVLIETHIQAVTGLHIGGSSTGLEIGGLDKAVIRNPLTNQPYIPGSSLRGKMRSQTEKRLGLSQNNHIGQVTIHTCRNQGEFESKGGCPVCTIFGVPAERGIISSTRLVVRDAMLTDESLKQLEKANTELSYAELKTEVAIDRVTSAATPRTLERVPAGAEFGPAELVYSIYEAADFERLKVVMDAMQLVEDDYLGGAGSRGSGKVRFVKLVVYARAKDDYSQRLDFGSFDSLADFHKAWPEFLTWLPKHIPVG